MERQQVVWAAVGIVLLAALAFLVYPKPTFKEAPGDAEERCECFGSEFWYGTRCVGVRLGCATYNVSKEKEPCKERTCQEVFDRLEAATARNGKESLAPSQGMDVVLVMDSSKSMEGERMRAAKEAARQLVDDLQKGERLGLVTFSESARTAHQFSSNKTSLSESIDSINESGGTVYLPALREARGMFEGAREAKKGIIFFSDGNPRDDEQEIVELTHDLQERDIALFTISFGEETQSSDILARMVTNGEDRSTSKWHRKFQDTESITNAFSDAWEEISNIDILEIEPTFDEGFAAGQVSEQGVRVTAGSTYVTRTGAPGSLCIPPMEVTAHVRGGNMTLEPAGRLFVFPEGSLEAGTHNITVTASMRLNHNGSCVFSGTRTIRDVTVRNESCRLMSCGAARETLEDFDVAADTGALLPRREAYGRVAIMVDSSSSMEHHLRNVRRAADRLNRLLADGDRRALVSFADEASLVQPLTRDPAEVTEALERITPQGTTRLLPAAEKADFLFENRSPGDVAVLVTDGEFHDREGKAVVEERLEGLAESGVCLYVVGYGRWLGDAEHREIFREVARRSQEENECGGFTYAPDSEELSSMVVGMFGGERPGNGTLRVVVDRDRSVGGRLSLGIRVVSMKTGLELPHAGKGGCLPFPPLDISISHQGEEVDAQQWRVAANKVKVVTPYLLPGSYDVHVEARTPIEGCSLSGEAERSFVVKARPEDPTESVVFVIIVGVAGLLVWSGRRLQKSLQG